MSTVQAIPSSHSACCCAGVSGVKTHMSFTHESCVQLDPSLHPVNGVYTHWFGACAATHVTF